MELERGYAALWTRKAEMPGRKEANGKIGGGERVETEARKRWRHAEGRENAARGERRKNEKSGDHVQK